MTKNELAPGKYYCEKIQENIQVSYRDILCEQFSSCTEKGEEGCPIVKKADKLSCLIKFYHMG